MAVISRRYGYLFLHAPRTAGTPLAQELMTKLAGTQLPREHVDVRTRSGAPRLVRQHITLEQLLVHGLLESVEARTLLKFATVRNPFDVLVSAYVKKREVVEGRAWTAHHPGTRPRI